jgi:cytochrome c oxidase subunit 1
VHSISRLCLAHFWVAFAAFLGAAGLGAFQMWVRSPLGAHTGTPGTYYMSVTAHGVAMAYVLSTFFIMGFGYFVAVSALNRPLPGKGWAWGAFVVGVIGVVMALVTIGLGKASVLYTFYPPLTASPWFYIGLVLVVAASWVWCVLMLVAMTAWKRENPGRPVPLAMFATTANALLWLWTTVGMAVEVLYQVLPAALGLVQTVDVGLSRTLFSWTLHAIVYFWLMPAYIAFYTMLPRAAGGRLYSDTMGRLTFIFFLLFSLPVGIHHLLMDPEHGNGFKFIQVLLTAFVTAPTVLTIFTIPASLEIAGRLRGGRGVFGWIAALPWDRPMVLASGFSFVMLGFGGLGGLINMAYGMNAMIHNTAWVTAHFHLIYGGTSALAVAALALVRRHDDHDAALALARPAGAVAPCRQLQLRQSDHRELGPASHAVTCRGAAVACFGAVVHTQFGGPASQRRLARAGPLALCACRRSAAARSRGAERIRTMERVGPCCHADGLWLSDRAVCYCSVADRDRSQG